MKIPDFNKKIAEKEGKKKQVNIAQITEVIKVANILTKNKLYQVIRQL